MATSRALKGSQNYIWWERDELGKGATAKVYKCREKKTGDVYAVKVYTARSREYRVPDVHQEREFGILKMLKHENIVKMLAIEEESQTEPNTTPNKVIVMEFCNAGSLYSILEEPKNAYGLDEAEFLLFLSHITEGMRYLRQEKIVHRDIKPGNIMKQITPEGRSIYKLTDFGAARTLDQQDESFTSMYGTEEYLHPDLYDRAVVRKGFGKKSFTSAIDLWSVGATIYHVATGTLPFRPHGGRRNREGMQRILTNKKQGVISGVQEMSGEIVYDDKLPVTCSLSDGLKTMLVPLLAGLLEVSDDKCFNFDQYFDSVSDIVYRTVVTVFDVCHGGIIKIYSLPSACLAHVKCQIGEQTGYRIEEQLLLYENSQLEELTYGPESTADKFPVTSDENPIFLYNSTENHDYTDNYPKKHFIPKFPKFGASYHLDQDYALAKACSGILLYICKKVKYCLSVQTLMDKAVKSYENFLIRAVKLLKDNIELCLKIAEAVQSKFSFMKDLVMLPSVKPMNPLFLQRLPEFEQRHLDINGMMRDLKRYGDDYKEKLADRKELSQKWKRTSLCEKDKCYDKISSLAQCVDNCRKEFENDKNLRALPYNEEQIHKFEKNKMSACCTEAVSLHDEHCWNNTKKMYHYFIQNTRTTLPASWFQMAHKIRTKCDKLENKMRKLKTLSEEMSVELRHHEIEIRKVIDTSITRSAIMAVSPHSSGFFTMSEEDLESIVTDMMSIEQEVDYSTSNLTALIHGLQ